MKPLIKKIVGNRNNTFVWHDNWHILDPLKDKYGYRVIYDSSFPNDALFKEIIHKGSQRQSTTNSVHLLEIKNAIMPNSGC